MDIQSELKIKDDNESNIKVEDVKDEQKESTGKLTKFKNFMLSKLKKTDREKKKNKSIKELEKKNKNKKKFITKVIGKQKFKVPVKPYLLGDKIESNKPQYTSMTPFLQKWLMEDEKRLERYNSDLEKWKKKIKFKPWNSLYFQKNPNELKKQKNELDKYMIKLKNNEIELKKLSNKPDIAIEGRSKHPKIQKKSKIKKILPDSFKDKVFIPFLKRKTINLQN